MNNEQLNTLLDKIGVIRYKQNVLDSKRPYNVFDVLHLRTDEVKLHSRFLGDLLNPKGAHGLGLYTLKEFLSILAIENFDTTSAWVSVEKHRIDLLITNNKSQAIIIENKIYAGDRMGQMEDYKNRVVELGFNEVQVFYLTLDGKEPDGAQGNLKEDEYSCIAYKKEIKTWISRCMQLSVQKPALRESLAQYLDIINLLTDNNMDNQLRDELFDLMSKGDNMLNAHLVSSNWGHLQYRTERAFWTDFEEAIISNKYTVLELQKWSNADAMDALYNSNRHKPYYGLLFEICKWKDLDVCILIEASPYANDEGIYYGLTLHKDGERNKEIHFGATELIDSLKPIMSFQANHSWLGGKGLTKTIDFRKFQDEETLRLANEEFRKGFIAESLADIESFINDSKRIISEL